MKQRSLILKTLARLLVSAAFGVSSLQASFPAGSNTFASATVIPDDEVVSLATNLTAFTSEVGEPPHDPGSTAFTARNTAWWTWTAPADGYCTVDTLETVSDDFPIRDTLVAVYTGNAVNALTRVVAGSAYSSSLITLSHRLSQVSFYAVKGTQYRIAVDAAGDYAIDGTSYNVKLRLRLLELRKMGRISILAFDEAVSGLGMITFEMTATGKLSGKLMIGTKTYPFAGAFGGDGYFQTTISQKTPGALPIVLLIDGTGEGAYQASIGGEFQIGTAFPKKVLFTPLNPNSVAGTYTAYMKGNGGDDPGGIGVISLKVAANGTYKGVGNAPDGTPITFSGALCEHPDPNTYYVIGYRALNGGKAGFVLAALLKETGGDDRLNDGGGIYLRAPNPAPGAAFYPAGFIQNFSLEGGTYRKPAVNAFALGFLDPTGLGQMTLTNSGGELPGNVVESLTLDTKGKFIFTSAANKPALKLNTATGLVTGSITVPSGKKRVIKGVLTNDNFVPVLRGYATGTTRNVAMKVEP